ncbi:class I SAM-dependent methyltransferase [Kordiimonas aquimaris]|uniref:class I SAM-dependent methyltransferase n=1 Tax=Kordiimonas aquimaris TaxID=707591 RepID=UPI0021D06F23|nr:class I SAM-dependent methyltransferase [Kordiimonas aquimaris]
MASDLITYLDKRFYPSFSSNWDDQLFRAKILNLLQADHDLLDMGAGAGIVSHMNFKGVAKHVTGIDLDPRVVENPFLNEGIVCDVATTPLPDNQFDFIICDNVLEHITEAGAFFKEVTRLLKPGGRFLGKTPNKYHYMPLIARLTPHWFHRFYNRMRGREAEDTFPTQYKVNSVKDVYKLTALAGLDVLGVELVEGRPEYMRIFAPLYLFGIVYERLINRFGFLKRFSILLIVDLEKPKVN